MRPARVVTFCSEMLEEAGVPEKMYNLSWGMLSREEMGMPRSLVRTSFCWFHLSVCVHFKRILGTYQLMSKHLRSQEGVILRKRPVIKNKQKLNTPI